MDPRDTPDVLTQRLKSLEYEVNIEIPVVGGVNWCLHRLENKIKNQMAKQMEFSLGCSHYWPIPEQRGGMNPTPATTQDGLVLLLVRFLFESFLFPLKEWINLNIGLRFHM